MMLGATTQMNNKSSNNLNKCRQAMKKGSLGGNALSRSGLPAVSA